MQYRLRTLLPFLLLASAIVVIVGGAALDSNPIAVTGACLFVASGVSLSRLFERRN
jgi:hypothetical protein